MSLTSEQQAEKAQLERDMIGEGADKEEPFTEYQFWAVRCVVHENEKMFNEIARLRAALEPFSNPDNWEQVVPPLVPGQLKPFYWRWIGPEPDPPGFARKALEPNHA